jgi:transposase-like protein
MPRFPKRTEDFPRTLSELEKRFSDELSCRQYLDSLRWRGGFECPGCGGGKRWMMDNVVSVCSACRRKTSPIAGTIFDKTRTPLPTWFRAAWLLTTQKSGFSAKALQRTLGLGGYQTAWTMLHKFRLAMVRPGRDRLQGEVEVDETFVGGVEKEDQGRGRKTTTKQIVVIAVEFKPGEPSYGRIRMERVPDFTRHSLIGFIERSVERGTIVHTDGLNSYRTLEQRGYPHRAMNLSGSPWDANEVMPAVHRVASLFKRWWLGTHQGVMAQEHLQAYLNEFTFRFNRRKSRDPGLLFYRLLEQAVVTGPTTYGDLTSHENADHKM